MEIRRGGDRAVVRWGAVALALSLAAVAWAAEPQDKPGTSAFPASDRPVASIISPEYSNSEYLDQLRERLARERIAGVQLILGLPRDPRLPTDSVDVAVLSHMYHEIENSYEFLYRLQSSLTPGARVGIIDMDRPTQSHGTPPALLRSELAAVGYRQLDSALLSPRVVVRGLHFVQEDTPDEIGRAIASWLERI